MKAVKLTYRLGQIRKHSAVLNEVVFFSAESLLLAWAVNFDAGTDVGPATKVN